MAMPRPSNCNSLRTTDGDFKARRRPLGSGQASRSADSVSGDKQPERSPSVLTSRRNRAPRSTPHHIRAADGRGPEGSSDLPRGTGSRAGKPSQPRRGPGRPSALDGRPQAAGAAGPPSRHPFAGSSVTPRPRPSHRPGH